MTLHRLNILGQETGDLCFFHMPQAKNIQKDLLCQTDKTGLFTAKDYLNGAELGEKLPKSNVPVLLDKLEFTELFLS